MVTFSKYVVRPFIQEIRRRHLSYFERRLIVRWHFNEGLPIYSSKPGIDTCHARIKRVKKTCVYDVINDYLAWGYVRQRGRNITKNHRRGHLRTEHWASLERLIKEKPYLYIDEIRDAVNTKYNMTYHYSVIQKALLAHNYTWKKIETMARQQNLVRRRQYLDLIERHDAKQMYFFDESHIDEITGCRTYGRSRRGRRCIVRRTYGGTRTRLSLLGLFSHNGFEISGCRIVQGNINAERFLEYVVNTLVHLLCPYTGPDSPLGSVLILDNARTHWSDEVIDVIRATGCRLIFLPPYSPDLNPIELGFGLLKSRMKRLRSKDLVPLTAEVWRALHTCCDGYQARGLFRRCGLSLPNEEDEKLQLLLLLSMMM